MTNGRSWVGYSALPSTGVCRKRRQRIAYIGRSHLTAVRPRYEPAAENRMPRRPLGNCQFHLGFRPYGLTASRGKLCRQPPHSHSIVSGTFKHLKDKDFVSERANFTVRLTVTIFRLGPTDSDRCRNRIYVHRYFRTTQLGVRSAPAHCSRAQAGSTAIPNPFAAWRTRSSRLSSLSPTSAERATRSDAR